jgi:hypothetical protein
MPGPVAGNKQQTLLRVGPFTSLDATTNAFYVDQNKAVAASNGTTQLTPGAFRIAPGRTLLGFENVPIQAVASFDPTGATRFVAWSAATASPPVKLLNPATGTSAAVSGSAAFTQAVQFGNRLFTNAGQQILNGVAYTWQQLPVIRTYTLTDADSAPFATGTYTLTGSPFTGNTNSYIIGGVTVTHAQTTGNTLAQQAAADVIAINAGGTDVNATSAGAVITVTSKFRGTVGNGITTTGSSTGGDTVTANQANLSGGANGPYTPNDVLSYAFTRVTTFPDGTQQESTPDGALVTGSPLAYPYSYLVTGDGDGPTITPSAPWSGTNSDGSTYATYVYRWSASQPIFYWLDGPLTGSGTYTDAAGYAALLPNAQLTQNQDPPPIPSGVATPGIFSHKNRIFVFTTELTQDLDVAQGVNYSVYQSQLWFSDYGTPYAFNAVDQVLLVGQDAVPDTPLIDGFGDVPLGGLSLSSIAVLFKARSTWVLYGDDQSTFLPRKIADVGCQSVFSAANCEGLALWLTERGVYACDGNAMKYVGEPVRAIINAIPQADRQAAVGWYGTHVYYLAFPATQITLRYYIPDGYWMPQLNYAATCGFAVPSEPQPGSTTAFNYIVTADARGSIFLWDAALTDAGEIQTATWVGPQHDSGAPWMQKVYKYVTVLCPDDAQGLLTVTLVADGRAIFTGTFNLATGPAVTQAIPGDSDTGDRGFTAYLALSVTPFPGSTGNPEISAVIVSGTMDREFVIPDSYAGA